MAFNIRQGVIRQQGGGANQGMLNQMKGFVQAMELMASMAGGNASQGFQGNARGQNMNMKPGDWLCGSCGDHQFATNQVCRKCAAPRPAAGGRRSDIKSGDWICQACGDHQFARNEVCRKCGGPKTVEGMRAGSEGTPGTTMKRGDWLCGNCGDHQYTSNEHCRKCGQAKTVEAVLAATQKMCKDALKTGGVRPGDWICSCGDLQFMRNETCKKCGSAKNEQTVISKEECLQPGDWICVKCDSFQFARNARCKDCNEPKCTTLLANKTAGGGASVLKAPSYPIKMETELKSPAAPASGKFSDWTCVKCGSSQCGRASRCTDCNEPKCTTLLAQKAAAGGTSVKPTGIFNKKEIVGKGAAKGRPLVINKIAKAPSKVYRV